MSKVGRNDPCPCGSGKKYKNCHMQEDEEKELAQKEEEERIKSEKSNVFSLFYDKDDSPDEEDFADEDSIELEDYEFEDDEDIDFFDELENEEAYADDEDELSPEEEKALDEFRNKFNYAGFNEKVSMMEEAFDNPELAYPDLIFDLFDEMNSAVKTSSDRETFIKMVKLYKEKLPDEYEEDAGNILDYCIDFAIIDNKPDVLKSIFLECANYVEYNIELFMSSTQEIAYHGYLELLVEGFRIGWKKIRDTDYIDPWEIEMFSYQGFKYELFNHLQNNSHVNTGIDFNHLSTNEKILADWLNYYDDFDKDNLSKFYSNLTRLNAPFWKKELFEKNFEKLKKADKTEYFLNRSFLSNEFIDYLHKDRNKSYPKADLMRSGIISYLEERMFGNLKKLFIKNNNTKIFDNYIAKALYPDQASLEKYLNILIGIAGFDLYKALALYESIPYWLDFLQLNNLIDETVKNQLMQSISTLNNDINEVIEKRAPYDEFLKSEMKATWNNT